MKYRLVTWSAVLFSCSWGCSPDDTRQQPAHTAWELLERLPEPPPPLDFDPALLTGVWSGPEQVGGCIDLGRWLEFESDGRFTYGQFEVDSCMTSAALSRCEGGWSIDALDERDQSGELTYACERAVTEANVPLRRALNASTFAVFEREGGFRELTTMAFVWGEDGVSSRRYEEALVYASFGPGQPPERSESRIETRFELVERSTGEQIRSVSQLSGLSEGRVMSVGVNVELLGEAQLAPFNERESGMEIFSINGVIEVMEGGEYRLRLALSGESDFEAWSRYLGDRGVFTRYASLGATMSVGMTRTLYLSPSRPGVWYGAGIWLEVEGGTCGAYGDRVDGVCGE